MLLNIFANFRPITICECEYVATDLVRFTIYDCVTTLHQVERSQALIQNTIK